MVTADVLSSQKSCRRRSFLSWLMLISIILLLLGILAITLIFAYPRSDLYIPGAVADFPPSEQPYLIRTKDKAFWLVNDGEQLLALYQKHPRSPFCPIRWIEQESRFIDPCWGTQFWINGMYMKGPPANMDRYPVEIQDEKIIVDLSRLLPRQPVQSNFPMLQD